ncbi:MAG: alanine--glyoxylate aminotransferase family protein [Thermomicrobiales bacterium]
MTGTGTRETLRIPGPTPVPPEVVAAMGREMISHRGAEFRAFYTDLLGLVRRAHRTEHDVLIWPGSGSAGWESVVVNLFSPGDPVLATVCGDFGHRFAGVAETFGLDVERLEVPWGRAVTPEGVAKALARRPGTKAVFIAYNETSTALTNPLPEIARVVREHGALVVVDAVSAAGGLPLETDAWGVDVVLSGSQKAWMCPPGLLLMAIGPRAWAAHENARFPRFFWDWTAARRQAEQGMTPTTPPLSLLFGLDAALRMIFAEEIEATWARHATLGEMVRADLLGRGLRLFPDPAHASNTVTGFRPPEGIAARAVVAAVRERHGIALEAGKGATVDSVVRLGHMGWVHEPEMRLALDAIGESVEWLVAGSAAAAPAMAGSGVREFG